MQVNLFDGDKTASLLNGFNPSYATSESGDLYLCSSNTNYYGVNESVPSGIVRINSGESDFDDNYFLDITAATGGLHSLGMIYVGNNKAIVQVLQDYNLDFFVDYYEVNLVTKSTRKLDVPTSNLARQAMDILENGNVIMASNNSNDNALYIYNATSGEVTKGLVYIGADKIEGVKAY